ncbi:MAG: sigma-54 dependent transcriptional regulator [Planctomycetota bacterium]|nr:sigma-54 dependent transcriptional regulator [Planctomycetota bacterium]
MAQHSLEIELREGLQGLDEVHQTRRFEVLASTLLGVLLKQFDARCAVSLKLGCVNRDGTRLFEEVATRTAGGLRPSECIDQQLIQHLGSIEGPHHLCEPIQGTPVSLISFSMPTPADGRVMFLVEVDSAVELDEADASSLAAMITLVEDEILDSILISDQARKIEQLEGCLERAEQALAENEIELSQLDPVGLNDGETPPATIKTLGDVASADPQMCEVLSQLERLQDSDLSVLICGETGTGKSLLARTMHQGTAREGHPFEVVSCGALAPTLVEGELFGWRKGAFSGADSDRAGVFERAAGGVVFLDEVGDLPLGIQQKLLRVLQEGVLRPVGGSELIQVDVRVVSSTCQDLAEMVRAGQFREDLFYRLAGFTIDVPPLRQRTDDIPQLVRQFLSDASGSDGPVRALSRSAMAEMVTYPWPGNLQQLRNVIHQVVLSSESRTIPRKMVEEYLEELSDELLQGEKVQSTVEELVLRIPATEGFNDIIAEVERLVILTALRRNRGNKSRVTKQLKIPRQTLYNKLDRYGIDESEYK